MDPKSELPKFEDTYRLYEFAPLIAFALIIANWLKPRHEDRPVLRETDASEAASGNVQEARQS